MSSRHPRIPSSMNLPTGPERVKVIERKLDDERRVYRESAAGTYNEMIASKNIEDLEKMHAQAERNERARAKLEAQAQARRDETNARIEQRRQHDAAQLKEDLRRRYRMADRTATDADFERAYPALLEDHRRARMAEDEEARQRMARSIRL